MDSDLEYAATPSRVDLDPPMSDEGARTDRELDDLPPSLRHIVQEVRRNRQHMSPALARRIVEESGVSADDLAPWTDFDHPREDSYGRKLAFHDSFFEIMVMSWVPGDMSEIHDHGHTLWGAVKVFGPAEHAAFSITDQYITTTVRESFEPERTIAVGHELLHQMGNRSEHPFLTLHLYGVYDPDFSLDSVTADARVVDLTTGSIHRTDGGMFFALPAARINRSEPAPIGDFLTTARHLVEYLRRLGKMVDGEAPDALVERFRALESRLFDPVQFTALERDLARHVDSDGHVTQLHYWQQLRRELTNVAALQRELSGAANDGGDSFHTYAALYDEVVGQPSLDGFIDRYLGFANEHYDLDLGGSTVLSIGCGTGLTEAHLQRRFSMDEDQLLGIDISEAMVDEASKRISARTGDILRMPVERQWDVTYQGLNVFQYLPGSALFRAIVRTAMLTRVGGHFIGDFVTPDHIRWYPHVVRSENVISLRQPRLVEISNATYQRSEIVNVAKLEGRFRITDEGAHLRHLPSMWKMRHLFSRAFGGAVDIYDAISLERVEERHETTPSTRYLLVANRR
jgi:SAM-dependent methyltransferase/predicted metal-dependent enzyme (double-stranded beta helix superfamily)